MFHIDKEFEVFDATNQTDVTISISDVVLFAAFDDVALCFDNEYWEWTTRRDRVLRRRATRFECEESALKQYRSMTVDEVIFVGQMRKPNVEVVDIIVHYDWTYPIVILKTEKGLNMRSIHRKEGRISLLSDGYNTEIDEVLEYARSRYGNIYGAHTL